jgi:NAD(P)H-dependent FMN reductase
LTGFAGLPFFNPDLDGAELSAAVAAFRTIIGSADGVLISSPEYARGVAGVMKNALDWLVASFEFPGKPVALINTSPRATHALAALRLTLETMSARIVDGPASHSLCSALRALRTTSWATFSLPSRSARPWHVLLSRSDRCGTPDRPRVAVLRMDCRVKPGNDEV